MIKRKKFRVRMLLFVPICLFSVATLSLSIIKYWVEILDLYNQNSELNEQLVYLKEEEEILKVDVEKLQDPEYVARYAREKYFYSGKNEIILNFPD